MDKIYNFSAGPSMLPEWVLLKAQKELLNYKNTGQSVMEMSHRSSEFQEILHSCKTLLKEVLKIPDDYSILFLQGGASSQFAMVPMNLMNKSKKADFILSGEWSEKAYKEALKYGNAKIVASSKEAGYKKIPKLNEQNLSHDADYLHFCYNNTIYGTRFNSIPTKKLPLVCDISSFIASEPLNISDFALVYAGTQKNLGIAGLTIVIVKNSFMGHEMDFTPTMFSYKTHAEKNSLYNTPPCYAIYMCMLALKWLKTEVGGLEKIKEINLQKSKLIYDYIDNSNLFKSNINKFDRSTMNVVFSTYSQRIDSEFVDFAAKNGIINLKGHRKVGGIRASIYNGMPLEGVEKLVEIMEKFEKGVVT